MGAKQNEPRWEMVSRTTAPMFSDEKERKRTSFYGAQCGGRMRKALSRNKKVGSEEPRYASTMYGNGA